MGVAALPSPRLPQVVADGSPSRPCLSAVLLDLGHACAGACRAAAEELVAEVWFARHGPVRSARRCSAVVVIDTTGYAGPEPT